MPSPTELYKDKIEVSLDGRQIFYLFFGGAVIVGLVFVLGVMVGRRVEARGHVERARTHAAADPLAALDRLESGSGLSFQEKLTGADAPTEVEKKIAAMAAKPAEGKATDRKAEEKRAADEKKLAEDKKAADEKAKRAAEEKKAADEKVLAEAEAKQEKERERQKKAAEEKQVVEDKPRQRWTLQLSSFQDRSEAESFLAAIKATGYQPHMTEADVDGKTYYRVRLGTYKSIENATNAKTDFEKSTKKSASIMKL